SSLIALHPLLHAVAWCAVCSLSTDTSTTEIYTLSLHDALPISFALQYVFRPPLGTGGVAQVAVEHGLHRRVAAAQGVTHHHRVDILREVLRQETFLQADARRLQLGAHGGIDVGLGPAHGNARLARQQ